MTSENSDKWSTRLDKLGMSASFFCAIHCALMPIAVGILPLFGLSFLANHAIEDTVIVGAFLIASMSLLPSYFRTHKKIHALLIFSVGFALIILGHSIDAGWASAPMAVIGGLSIALAHWINRRECKKCPKCQEGCTHESHQ